MITQKQINKVAKLLKEQIKDEQLSGSDIEKRVEELTKEHFDDAFFPHEIQR